MKILITNPTGKIGLRLVRELLAPDFSVRVVVRDPARLPEEIREQVETVRGSTDDVETLCRALDDVEALFWCVPTESFHETNVEQHYERFACAGWQAIRKAGTPRVVTISAVGKGRTRLGGRISGLHAMEEILNESGAGIRHLRCGVFMENFHQETEWLFQRGVLSYPVPSYFPIPMVAVADIADVALRSLVRRDWSGTASLAVHGPEDLSYGEAAAIMGRVLACPVGYEQSSITQYVERMVNAGASMEHARSLAAMHAELAQGIAHAEPRTPQSTTRTTLATWTARELLPAAQSLFDGFRSNGHLGRIPLGGTSTLGSAAPRMHLGL